MSAVRLKDVSEETGFSLSTVSLVLNNRSEASIPEDTRKKVKDAATKLGYVRRSRSSSSRTLVIAIFEDLRDCFENPYFGEIYRGVQEALKENGYHSIIQHLGRGSALREVEIAKSIKAEGILVLGAPPASFRDSLRKFQVPVVFVNATVDHAWDSVIPDFEHGFRIALQILKDHGHRRILCVKSAYTDEKLPYLSDHLIRAIRTSGVSEGDIIYVRSKGNSSEDGYSALLAFLKANPSVEFTAAFSGFSKPFGMIRALEEQKREVPGDVSVIAIGGDPHVSESRLPISTVLYPLRQVGKEGVHRLIARARGTLDSPATVVLPVRYEDRGTVGKARM
ncbi:LacI family DNA-binding transcriptional regulator [Puniceicoccus vermicola]|uniref:LacI family DNA-binding transcriptional regulator n=1 Tax=Puniceicoccus vermicola TaxID=388746 RepID=A0A7X1E5R1_9BACT|nr:LacI family DNA-binding transcriptional regulator [Puniceicoccus vermicola]MBC2603426.1 LacI family DNA-binding transcriptional regulator [Puniceicoccus vermicola]